jgi:MoaA/NifB/PqqE/SkfB family radical SAM enzyme
MDEMVALPSIDWWVTAKCNLHCSFCYGPSQNADDDRSLTDATLARIHASSARAVTLCGGEPLVRRDLGDLLEMLAPARKILVLNTNGELLRFRASRDPRLIEIPDIIGISIDGPDSSGHQSMRGTLADFAEVIAAAHYANAHGKRLKIGTVVSRLNIDTIPRMAELVRELHPMCWRLYQYADRSWQGSGVKHCVSNTEFAALVATLTDTGCAKIMASTAADTEGCFIVSHDGTYLYPEAQSYRAIGHVRTDDIDTCVRVRWPDREKLRSNKRWLAADAVPA